jgi:hypothetical protein
LSSKIKQPNVGYPNKKRVSTVDLSDWKRTHNMENKTGENNHMKQVRKMRENKESKKHNKS